MQKRVTDWAQKYSHDLKPSWARNFKSPGLYSAVTAGSYEIEGSYIEYYFKIKSLSARRYLANSTKSLTLAQCRQKAERLHPNIEKIIASMDDTGRWPENKMIYSSVFVRNVHIICNYLVLALHHVIFANYVILKIPSRSSPEEIKVWTALVRSSSA